jgi:hypothetical protein
MCKEGRKIMRGRMRSHQEKNTELSPHLFKWKDRLSCISGNCNPRSGLVIKE